MVKAALRIMRFTRMKAVFGASVPRGHHRIRKLLQRFHDGMGQRSDIALIGDLAKNMLGKTSARWRCGGAADHLYRREVLSRV